MPFLFMHVAKYDMIHIDSPDLVYKDYQYINSNNTLYNK